MSTVDARPETFTQFTFCEWCKKEDQSLYSCPPDDPRPKGWHTLSGDYQRREFCSWPCLVAHVIWANR